MNKKKDTRKRTPPKRLDITKQRWDKFIKKFMENDLKDPVGTYVEVYGCKIESARPAVSRLLHLPSFQEHLAKRIQEVLGHEKATLELRIVKSWVTRAFYDISNILDEDGRLIKSMDELKEEGLSCVIDGIDIRVDKDGGEHVVYKLADRDKALSMLKDYGQIITEPVKNVNLNIENGESLAPKIFIVQRRTVEEWQEFYKTITSGGPSQDKPLPSLPPPSRSFLEAQKEEERATSFSQTSPQIMNTGVKRGEAYYFAGNTKNSKK